MSKSRTQTCANLAVRQAPLSALQQRENHLPPFFRPAHVAGDWPGDELTVPEPDRDGPAVILDLRGRDPCSARQRRDLERSTALLLDDPATVERAGNQRVSRSRLVRREQLLRRQAEVQGTGGGDLQAVVVDRDADRAAPNGVVTVAQSVR